MEPLVRRNRPLVQILKDASSEELTPLADALTDEGKGRVSLDKQILDLIEEHKASGTLPAIASILDSELRRFGGNSAMNLVRRDGVRYETLLADVAGHLGLKVEKDIEPHEIEARILEHLAALESAESSDTGQPSTGLLGKAKSAVPLWMRIGTGPSSLAGAAAKMTTAGAAAALGTRIAAVAAPVIAVPATGALIAYEATTPALRVTVPAVRAIAKIRARQIEDDYARHLQALEDMQ